MKTQPVVGWITFQALLVSSLLFSTLTVRSGSNFVPPGAIWKYLDDGSDQGTLWRTPDFDDSSWQSGPAQLGYGEGDEATVVSFGPDPVSKYITTYFRHEFDVADASMIQSLALRVIRDDGVAIYLNGTEVFRSNLDVNPINFDTFATAVAQPENDFIEATISSSALVTGQNVLAVEVHQVSSTSSDLGFDLELSADDGPPPIELPVLNLATVDGIASEQDLSVPSVPIDNGLIRINRTGSLDQAIEVLVAYGGTADNGEDFSLLPESVMLPAGQSTLDLVLEPIDDEILEGDEIATLQLLPPPCLNQTPPEPGCYRIGPNNQASVTIRDNEMPPLTNTLILVPSGALWKYLDDGSNQGTNWRTPDFDDVSWQSGPAQLGYGDGDESTVVSFGPSSLSKYITTYFRHAFDVGDISTIQALTFRVLRDDGVAIYLNGNEVFRNNLPPGEVLFDTLATSVAANENDYLEASIPHEFLVTGQNVIAAEVHQVNPASSDIGFDLELWAGETPPPVDLPQVSVMATDTSAAESEANPGRFRITRSGSTELPLVVYLGYSGTAQNGMDYASLPGQIEIPTGEPSVDLVVEPVNDQLEEGTETVSIMVLRPSCANAIPPGDACYLPGPAVSASISILDDDAITPPPDPHALVSTSAIWKYLDNGSDQGTVWRSAEFDDHSWNAGPGPLGYGEGDEATVVSYGPDSVNKFITTYFRHTFDVADAESVIQLALSIRHDDAVAIYLNGTEVFRDNLPPSFSFNTLATSTGNERQVHEANIPSELLASGQNTLAAEVHQVSPGSSDLRFEFSLNATVQPPPPTLSIELVPMDLQSLKNGILRFMVIGNVEGPCVIETSTDMVHWVQIGTLDPSELGVEVTSPILKNDLRRFFRARALE